MNKTVIYTRFSSSNQREVSIEQQEKICREYATRNNMEVVKVYADKAISGKTSKRPSFQQMILDSAKKNSAM